MAIPPIARVNSVEVNVRGKVDRQIILTASLQHQCCMLINLVTSAHAQTPLTCDVTNN